MAETVIDGLARAIRTAAPSFEVWAGYSLDVVEWLQENRATGAMVLISHEGDEPVQAGEAGQAGRYAETYAVYIRTGVISVEEMSQVVRPTYRAIRNALAGLIVRDDDGKEKTVMIQPGRLEQGGGFALATLSLRVV